MRQINCRMFENLSVFCAKHTSMIPLTFILGFYVSYVIGRWWNWWLAIPSPDHVAGHIANYIGCNTSFRLSTLFLYSEGDDERSRRMRRTTMRYLLLSFIFTFRQTSSAVKKRFPTMQHIINAGILSAVLRVIK
jgi:hypothetical protein